MAVNLATVAQVAKHTKFGKAVNKLQEIAQVINGAREYPVPTPLEENIAKITWITDANGSFVPDNAGWDVRRWDDWVTQHQPNTKEESNYDSNGH